MKKFEEDCFEGKLKSAWEVFHKEYDGDYHYPPASTIFRKGFKAGQESVTLEDHVHAVDEAVTKTNLDSVEFVGGGDAELYYIHKDTGIKFECILVSKLAERLRRE